MEPLLNVLVRLRIPTIVVLGNHDYESGKEEELCRMIVSSGIKLLDGTAYERDGVGFAGTKRVCRRIRARNADGVRGTRNQTICSGLD
jgi:DNA repair exonuclease SbcCD nuclease subunit